MQKMKSLFSEIAAIVKEGGKVAGSSLKCDSEA